MTSTIKRIWQSLTQFHHTVDVCAIQSEPENII